MLKTQTALGDPPAGTDGGEAPGSRKIRLLYAGDMDFARAQFASEAPRLELVAATEASIRDAKSKGAAPPADVAFIDCSSSGVNATRLLQELRSAFPGMPVVVAVDPGRADAARDAVDLKADDFTVKSPGWLGRLPVRLGMVLSRQSHLSQFDTVRSREERLRGILESAPVCLVRLNRDATVLAINTAGRSLIGAGEAGAVLRKSILAFVSADDRDQLRGFVERVCSGQPGSMEFSTAGSSESARIVEASAIQLAPHAGRSETALLVLRDISARRRLERSLEQAEVPGPGLDNSNAIAELESRLSEAESHRLTLKAERDSLNEAVQDGNTAIEALSKKLQQRQLELNNVAAERDRLSEAVETTGQTIQALEARLEDNRGEVEAVSQRLHERECELHNIVAERSGLSQAVETTGQTVAALEAQLEEKRREVEEVSRRLHERERELHNIAAERSGLSQAVETTGQTVAALEAQLEEKRRDVEEVSRRLHERELELHSIAAERSGLSHAVEATSRSVGELEAQLEEKRREVEAVSLRLQERELELSTIAAERNGLSHAVETTSRSVGALEAQLEAKRVEVEVVSQRLQERERELDTIAAERIGLSHTVEVTGKTISALEGELEGQRLETGRLTAERDGLLATLREIQRMVAVLKQEFAKQRAESGELSSERDSLKRSLDEVRSQHAHELQGALAARNQAEVRLREAEADAEQKAAQLDDSKTECRRIEIERDGLQVSLENLRLQQSADRESVALLELQLREVDAAQLEAKAQHDRLESILAEAFEQYRNVLAERTTTGKGTL